MTRQEAFDKGVKHLLTQNKKSEKLMNGPNHTSYKQCMYRGEDGRMCGAGPFIPDDKYQESMEGKDIESIILWFNDDLSELRNVTDVLQALQRTHDESEPRFWRTRLERKAAQLGLDFNPPANEE